MRNLIAGLNIKRCNIQVIMCSLVLPSLLLPTIYSSILLGVLCLLIFKNLRIKEYKSKFSLYLLYPFFCLFISVLVSFSIDFFEGVPKMSLLIKNLAILIIPLFIITSGFNRLQIFKILKITSVIISFAGIAMILLWLVGYNKHSSQNEFQQNDWFKNELKIEKISQSNDSLVQYLIEPFSNRPGLRRIGSLSKRMDGNSIIREITIKVNKGNQDLWVLFRGYDNGENNGAWFNANSGDIGHVHKGMSVKSEPLNSGYYKFTLINKPSINATREWFYISFVSADKQYKLNVEDSFVLEIREPKFYTSTGENLLKKKSILNYKITTFSKLESYAHGTYMALVFSFALIFLLFNSIVRKWLRFLLIAVNVFVIFALASKAVILSLVIFTPIFFIKNMLSLRGMALICLVVVLLGFNGHVRARFIDLYETIVNVDDKVKLGELDKLSTSKRIQIYKTYYSLIKENYLIGYGYSNGNIVINSYLSPTFNAHNQYLQSLFNSGILGLIMLILFSISPLLFVSKNGFENDWGLMLFISIILFNFLFESILYRQWGIILVSFSFSILFLTYKPKVKWFQ